MGDNAAKFWKTFVEMLGGNPGDDPPTPAPAIELGPDPVGMTGDVVPIAGDSSTAVDADTDLGPDTVPGPTDVVPIAGDSGPPDDPLPTAPAPSGATESSLSRGIADDVENFGGDGSDDATGLWNYLLGLIRQHPWLAAALAALLIAIAVVVPVGFSSGGDKVVPPPVLNQTTTTDTTPTTTAAEPGISSKDVSITNFGLLTPQGFEFDLAAPASAPSHETVVLAFTGTGLASRQTVSVGAGKSVHLSYPTSGCGKWTVRVAAIDSTPIASKGNPDLENGMTHNC